MRRAFLRGWDAAAERIGGRYGRLVRPYRKLGAKGSWQWHWTMGFNAAVRSHYAWRRLQRQSRRSHC